MLENPCQLTWNLTWILLSNPQPRVALHTLRYMAPVMAVRSRIPTVQLILSHDWSRMVLGTKNYLIEAGTEWSPFYRRHFQMCFIQYFFISIKISLHVVSEGPIDNNSVLVQMMAWRWRGNNLSSDLMENQFTDTHTHIDICVTWPQCHIRVIPHWLSHIDRDKLLTLCRQHCCAMHFVAWAFFHRNLFLRVKLTIWQHWCIYGLGVDRATSHFLNQW